MGPEFNREKLPREFYYWIKELVPEEKLRQRTEQFVDVLRFLEDARHHLEGGDIDGFFSAFGQVLTQYHGWLKGIETDIIPELMKKYKESGESEESEITLELLKKQLATNEAQIEEIRAFKIWLDYFLKTKGIG